MTTDNPPNQPPIDPDDIPEVYEMESLEQLRAISDELRTRIVDALAHRAMTVTQLGEMLGQSPAKIHYHARELERVGLIRLVATREKSGILEKYYRAIAKSLTASRALLGNVSSDDTIATLRFYLDNASRAFLRATEFSIRNQLWENPKIWGLSTTQVWVTYEEMKALAQRVQAEFDKFGLPRGIEGEEERTIVMLGYDPHFSAENTSAYPALPPLPAPSAPPAVPAVPDAQAAPPKNGSRRARSRHMVVAGTVILRRSDLEEAIAQHRQLDISAIGVCTFADDVTPELVDQAIGHFRHRGLLTASPEVREALKRKEK